LKTLFTIVLVHQWSSEERTVPVETVTRTYVSVRWGQSGTYDLNLARNTLTARSQKAQRKGKPLWHAKDIDEVRRKATIHMNGGVDVEADTLARMAIHEANKPGRHSVPERLGDILARSGFGSGYTQSANDVCWCGAPMMVKIDSNPRIGTCTRNLMHGSRVVQS
jgi:hypothetical protein